MTHRNPWRQRPLVDENAWSLLPCVGVTRAVGWFAQALWLLFACVFLAQRRPEWESISLFWVIGAWSLQYITQRLGGREATLGAGAHVRPDSPLQMRLLGDSATVSLLIFAAANIALGADAVRALWRNL